MSNIWQNLGIIWFEELSIRNKLILEKWNKSRTVLTFVFPKIWFTTQWYVLSSSNPNSKISSKILWYHTLVFPADPKSSRGRYSALATGAVAAAVTVAAAGGGSSKVASTKWLGRGCLKWHVCLFWPTFLPQKASVPNKSMLGASPFRHDILGLPHIWSICVNISRENGVKMHHVWPQYQSKSCHCEPC